MLTKIRRIIDLIYGIKDNTDAIQVQVSKINYFESQLYELRLLTGKLHANILRDTDIRKLSDAEFKVFSQFGDDGIIQYLIHKLPISSERFIEFGVENYLEANTRFLLENNNWQGLIIDGNEKNIESVKRSSLYWRHDLTAVAQFITCENINSIFKSAGFTGEIGLLSIDIDGNDYWVWQAIDCIEPIIVVVEYNSVFGAEHAVTIPYQHDFYRTKAHYSNLYWGASLKALQMLARKKGYDFIGCNSAGNNAYFVRNDFTSYVSNLAESASYVESKFRESRDQNYNLTFIGGNERLRLIKDCKVYNTENNSVTTISKLFGI